MIGALAQPLSKPRLLLLKSLARWPTLALQKLTTSPLAYLTRTSTTLASPLTSTFPRRALGAILVAQASILVEMIGALAQPLSKPRLLLLKSFARWLTLAVPKL